MAKSDNSPEYPSPEKHREDLERDLAGLEHRLAELKEMPATHPDQITAQEEAIKSARANLRKYAGQAGASKRPKKASETT